MSEQIQSLLNEMENKFDQSFSQCNQEDLINESPNPQSAKKTEIKHEENKNQSDEKYDDFNDMKNLLIQQLENKNQNQIHNDSNGLVQQKQEGNDSNQSLQIKKNLNKKQNAPNFKFQKQTSPQDPQNLRKASSEQQFSKTFNQASQPNEQNPFYYKQLTMKLQKALMKISSQKEVGGIKKSYNFYDRIQQFELKKKRQIQRRKQQLQEKQISSVKDRPFINSHSRAIVAQVSNDPIYVRCDKIIQKRNEKEKQYEKIKQERKQKQYEEFKAQFDNYINQVKLKYEGKNIRSPDEYYHQMQTWMKTKERNLESKITQKQEKLKDQLSFKPLINSKSEKIILKKKQERRVPIYDREPKPKEQASDPNCTFKPKINKSSFYKKMTYYQTPV